MASSPVPATTPFVVITWSEPQGLVDGEALFENDVQLLIVPRHLVTPDRALLLAKSRITTIETDLIRSWLRVEWKAYRVKYGATALSIRRNAKAVCPCEDHKACPGRYYEIQYCKGCINERGLPSDCDYIIVTGKTEDERVELEVMCTRHPECWCRTHNESYCDPDHRQSCVFCAYVPQPKQTPEKQTKSAKKKRVAIEAKK